MEVLQMTNCICQHKMPVVEGYMTGKKISVLRDTGCNTILVRNSLILKDQLTGLPQTCVLIDGTIKTFPIANVSLSTPYFTGNTQCLVMDNPIYDVIIGNVKGARKADYPDSMKHPDPSTMAENPVQAVETRSMAKRKPTKPLKVLAPIGEVSIEEFQKEQGQDPSLQQIWKKYKEQKEEYERYKFIMKKGLLYQEFIDDYHRKGRQTLLVIPKKYKEPVLKLAHEGLMSGHQGINRTMDKIEAQFYWPGLLADVTHFCRSCDICQRTISKGKVGKVPLGKMPQIDVPFKRVAIDIVGSLTPISDRGNRYILVLVDYAHPLP